MGINIMITEEGKCFHPLSFKEMSGDFVCKYWDFRDKENQGHKTDW